MIAANSLSRIRFALLFNDLDTSDQIMISSTPLECKDLGKEVKGFKEDIW